MRYERLLTDKATAPSPSAPLSEFGRIWQLVVLLYALLATLALWTLVQAPAGIQHLLLLCLFRLSVLLCVGSVSYEAHRWHCTNNVPTLPFSTGGTASGGSNPATPRVTFAQAVLYLQLTWLASELALGSALLFYPRFLEPLSVGGSPATANTIGALLTLLPLLCAVTMSGCFLFLQHLMRRRRQRAAAASPRLALQCGGGYGTMSHHVLAGLHADSAATCTHHSSVDVICSPVSDDGSFSSCNSERSAAAFYSRSSSSSLGLGAAGCGGMPSPTSHVRGSSGCATAHHEAAIHAACHILLVEHQLDTNECVMFVHKKLRPIKTRPEDPRPPPHLLRDLISKSFTFQHDPELAAQLAVHAQAGGSGACGSGATSITFQTEAAAVSGLAAV